MIFLQAFLQNAEPMETAYRNGIDHDVQIAVRIWDRSIILLFQILFSL